jgi:hypothetical protein
MIQNFDDAPCWPIVGPTDSVIRFMRGETVFPEEVEEDTSRSDVWAVNKDQFDRWNIIYPASKPV